MHTNQTKIPVKRLKNVLSSSIWFDYECGRLSQDECYKQLAEAFSLEQDQVAAAFSELRDSIKNTKRGEEEEEEEEEEQGAEQGGNDNANNNRLLLAAWIRALKLKESEANDGISTLSVFAMCNLSQADFDALKSVADWSIFDRVFTSSEAGARKPELSFYKKTLAAIGAAPAEVIFVDDRQENLLSARSMGMQTLRFQQDDSKNSNSSPSLILRQLKNLLSDPIQRGRDFLLCNAKQMNSISNTGHTIRDNFAQLLMLEVTQDRNLIDLEEHSRTWNFFIDKPLLTTDVFPDDLDTTCTAWAVLEPEPGLVASVLDEIVGSCVNGDGIVMTYFDHTRPRVDPVVCVNVLRLFYKHGRGHELSATLQWVGDILYHRAYLGGTRYYQSPDAFLYFLSRLLSEASSPSSSSTSIPTPTSSSSTSDNTSRLHSLPDLSAMLRERITERVGAPGDAICLAMRLLACQSVGVSNPVDLLSLRSMQCEDGGWEAGWIYAYGSSGVMIGNRGLTTALAVNVLLSKGKSS